MSVKRKLRGLLFLVLLWIPQALAQVTGIEVSPGTVQLDVTRGLNTLVNWTVSFSGIEAVSRQGEFLDSRTVLGTNSTLLLLVNPRSPSSRARVSQREPLVVTPAMAQRWWDLGLRRVVYRREFSTNAYVARTADVIINLVSPRAPTRSPTTPPTTPPRPTDPLPPAPRPPSQPEPPTANPPGNPPVDPPVNPPSAPPVSPVPPGQVPVPPQNPPPGSPPTTPPTVEAPRPVPQLPVLREQDRGLSRLRSAQSVELAVYRLELAFEDLSVVRFVDQGAKLKARLQITYGGSGLLRGRWMLAGPATTAGKPLFVPLQSVNQQLTSSQRSEIASPVLPTNTPGRYYLLFCAETDIEMQAGEELALAQTCPNALVSTTVGYQVFPATAPVAIEAQTLPGAGLLNAETRFSWRPVSGAVLYQLQLLTLDGGQVQEHPEILLGSDSSEFVGGMVLAADTYSTTLSSGLLAQLVPSKRYSWRVTAYDKSGRVLGASRPRQGVFADEGAEQDKPSGSESVAPQ